ncbi:MAG: hypothetical protein JSU85_10605 [Candidatus Zixiibacteriota bacterium]|nr:MAG: hypothetical protein JSU85_10605 [candidate division Zixibacteria bacterium]
MRYLFLTLLIFYSAAQGDSEILYADSVSSPDQWINVGGASKVESVSDDVDGNYIDEITQGEKQRFTVEDAGDIGPLDIIDSIVIHSRFKTPSGTGVVARVNHIVSSTANGTSRTLTGSWANYTDTYSTDPDGGGWSLPSINNLKVEAETVTVPALKRAQCTRIYIVAYYTPVPAAPVYRRRIYQQQMLLGD